ncbi:zf-HC2 domain-containing protein [Nocardioides sp.]|uniref:zf-HC2 domain-containing protein n=1 Tax=Nocardioides sp. TaxID=35761 RepID=UPI00271F1F35|nr:zf-HC2 domain-containing protein [Nocardioides sp.]MDO9455665.1 zf-HC2 domain-containing protein [Nocardioides sp.]
MSMVNGGHLGRRVSDLLDGQLPPAEADAAWAHVHTCHACRDDVEREGYVKTRLSSLSYDDGPAGCAPDHLKGALLGMPPGDCFLGGGMGASHDLTMTNRSRSRRGIAGIAALGGGAAGAAVMGVLALGAASPADIPVPERRQQPVSHVTPSPVPPRTPAKTPVRLDR